jgi:D-alanyl-D-alanine carboxypeptidase
MKQMIKSGVIPLKTKWLNKFALIYIFVFLFTAFSVSLPVLAEEPPKLTSAAYILIDMETGQVLAEKDADARRSPASTTKIMTALVALEHADLDMEMTASERAIKSVGYDYVTAGIKVGETLKFKDLLDLMMITSANEASNIIAENIAEDGTIESFIELMNQKAQELGLTGTHFVNPNGTEHEDHYSTARDLANLGREAMKLEAFREVVGRTEFTLPDTNLRKSNEWKAGHLTFTNQLLISRSSYYSKVTGIKTGYTDNAGRCLVSSAINPDGLELIAVVLGADSYDTLYKESQKLLEYGFKNFSMQELVKKGQYVDRFEVADAVDGKKLEVITNSDFRHVLPLDKTKLNEELEVKKHFEESYAAPITQGQVVGKMEYYYKDELIGTVELVAKESIEKTTLAILRDKYKEIVNDQRFIFGVKVAGALIVLIIALSYFIRLRKRRNNRRKRYGSPSYRKNNHRFRNYL